MKGSVKRLFETKGDEYKQFIKRAQDSECYLRHTENVIRGRNSVGFSDYYEIHLELIGSALDMKTLYSDTVIIDTDKLIDDAITTKTMIKKDIDNSKMVV